VFFLVLLSIIYHITFFNLNFFELHNKVRPLFLFTPPHLVFCRPLYEISQVLSRAKKYIMRSFTHICVIRSSADA